MDPRETHVVSPLKVAQPTAQDKALEPGQGVALNELQRSARHMVAPRAAQLVDRLMALLEAPLEILHETTLHPRSKRRRPQ